MVYCTRDCKVLLTKGSRCSLSELICNLSCFQVVLRLHLLVLLFNSVKTGSKYREAGQPFLPLHVSFCRTHLITAINELIGGERKTTINNPFWSCFSLLMLYLMCCFTHVKNLSLLKAGKSTSWEDGGWGGWDEAELQEPVSTYRWVFIAKLLILKDFSTCLCFGFFSYIVSTWTRRILICVTNVTAYLSPAPVIVSKYNLDVTCCDIYSCACIL